MFDSLLYLSFLSLNFTLLVLLITCIGLIAFIAIKYPLNFNYHKDIAISTFVSVLSSLFVVINYRCMTLIENTTPNSIMMELMSLSALAQSFISIFLVYLVFKMLINWIDEILINFAQY